MLLIIPLGDHAYFDSSVKGWPVMDNGEFKHSFSPLKQSGLILRSIISQSLLVWNL
jgi:hypothetical protein